MEALKISLSGLNVEWQRLEVIAENLANINTTRNAAGNAYQPRRLVSGPNISFQSLLETSGTRQPPTGVQVLGIEPIENGLQMAYDPSHPHADTDGFVSYPKIDHAGEMTLMIKASRAYEANLTAMSISQQMYSRALEIGQRS